MTAGGGAEELTGLGPEALRARAAWAEALPGFAGATAFGLVLGFVASFGLGAVLPTAGVPPTQGRPWVLGVAAAGPLLGLGLSVRAHAAWRRRALAEAARLEAEGARGGDGQSGGRSTDQS